MKTDTVESLKKFKESAEIQKKFETQEVMRNTPKIIIYDVSNKVSERQIKKLIFEKNEIDIEWTHFHENCVPKFKTGPKGKENITGVFEVSPDVGNILIMKRNQYLESQSCRVLDYTLVRRCFKCQGFRHISKICSKEEFCSLCAETKHSHRNSANKENKANKNKCKNCKIAGKPQGHNLKDRKCPIYIKHLE